MTALKNDGIRRRDTRKMRTREKKAKLTDILSAYDRLAVAFSGGVDSAFLLAAAHAILGDRVAALTSVGLPHPRRGAREAARLAESIGVVHREVPTDRLNRDAFAENTRDRCYQCKKIMWAEIAAAAAELNLFSLADGVCVDDLNEFRPGLAAGREMGVVSPLADAGLTKQDIRELAKEAGLDNWDRPAEPCLATRVPYGTRLTPERLIMIEQAEDCLIGLGFSPCRVRVHAGMARIEVPEEKIAALSDRAFRQVITTEFKKIGFTHVTADLYGYISGGMDLV
ncbi:MAG: ATP-dependent sacrificial sulfur transferase LarE [Thermodesulfobacteriota bacterium]